MTNFFDVISPVDNSVFVRRSVATTGQMEKALASSKLSAPGWKDVDIDKRIELCRRGVDILVNSADQVAEELTRQMGRPIRYTPSEIKGGFRERALHMCSITEEALADVKLAEKEGFTRFIRKEPLGTVFVLAPWNYPYLTAVNAVVPALLAGNCVILKHAQQTPLCAERMVEAFVEAGVPEGVFQFLHLTHGQVAKVIQDPRINFVAFTGSVRGGQAVQGAIGSRFIGSGMELGGKDPAYVCADANLPYSIENLVDGSFFNSGQSCCGIERIYVQESLYDDFVSGFVQLTKDYILGDPMDPLTTLGPMVRTSAADFARAQVEDAIRQGATQLIDTSVFQRDESGTPYMAPQVLVKVDHSMQVMTEETFGPVVGIMPVKDDREAVRLMNDSRYGLTASIWSTDKERALHIGVQIQTGTCFMNRCDYLDPALAWTGIKDSGRGVTLSSLGFDTLTRPKSFHYKTTI